MDLNVSIKVLYRSKLTKSKGSSMYIGGFSKTFSGSDYLSMDYLMYLANKCNRDKEIDGLFYLLLAFSLKDGLRKKVGENDVVHLHVVVKNRVVNVYVLHRFLISSQPIPETELVTPQISNPIPTKVNQTHFC